MKTLAGDNNTREIVKALDRLSYSVIFAALISRQDFTIDKINQEAINRVIVDNFYTGAE